MKTWQNIKETNLPFDLLLWVVRDGIIKQLTLKTFLYIKLSYPDRLVLKPQLYHEISEGLKISTKTARAHIKELVDSNFIGFDQKTTLLYVRSKYSIVHPSYRKSHYILKVNLSHLSHFTEYILAASIAYIVRKKLLTAKYRPAVLNDVAFQGQYAAVSSFLRGCPISLSYIAEFLGFTTSWVVKYKSKAKKLGWITVKRFYMPTKIKWADRDEHCVQHFIPRYMIKKRRGHLTIKGPDLLSSKITIKKGKKVTKRGNDSKGGKPDANCLIVH